MKKHWSIIGLERVGVEKVNRLKKEHKEWHGGGELK